MGNVVKVTAPEIMHKMEVSESNWEIVREGMKAVTRPGGTAAASMSSLPVRVAGKTGSAQVAGRGSNLPTHSVYIGYAPADEPEIAFAVIIKYGETGSSAAAPAAARVLESYYTPDLPEEDEEEDPDV
jgi:penicillin-binding protein 2